MQRPDISYALNGGVRLAYCRLGKGPPLIYLPIGPSAHLQAEWDIPVIRDWYLELAEHFSLILYNQRGSGMSDRDVDDLSLDAMVEDLECVRAETGLQRVSIWGNFNSAPVAIKYAATFPSRVSDLILWCPYSDSSEYGAKEFVRQARDLIDSDYDRYLTSIAVERLGWAGATVREFVRLVMKRAYTPNQLKAFFKAFQEVHTSELLPRIGCSTLVMSRRNDCLDPAAAERIAKNITSSRLLTLSGESLLPYLDDDEGDILRNVLKLHGIPSAQPHRLNWSAFKRWIEDVVGHPDFSRQIIRAAVAAAVVALVTYVLTRCT